MDVSVLDISSEPGDGPVPGEAGRGGTGERGVQLGPAGRASGRGRGTGIGGHRAVQGHRLRAGLHHL